MSKAPTAKDIQTDLSRLEARRADLQTELETAQESLTRSRAALVDGDGTAADVTSAQSTYSALKEALIELDTRIAKRQEEHQAALGREHREEQTHAMLEAANTATAHREAFAKTVEEANRVLAPFIERMSAAVDGMIQARVVFVTTGVTVEPGLRKNLGSFTHTDLEAGRRYQERRESAEALIEQLRSLGADLATVLTPWAGTKSYVDTEFDKASPLPTPEPYGLAILEGMAAKRKAEREERQRQENAVKAGERLAERRATATAQIWVPVMQGKDVQKQLGELVKDTVRINRGMIGGEDQTAFIVRHNDLERAKTILAEKLPGCEYSVKRDMTL